MTSMAANNSSMGKWVTDALQCYLTFQGRNPLTLQEQMIVKRLGTSSTRD
jgi:hypothetical protein